MISKPRNHNGRLCKFYVIKYKEWLLLDYCKSGTTSFKDITDHLKNYILFGALATFCFYLISQNTNYSSMWLNYLQGFVKFVNIFFLSALVGWVFISASMQGFAQLDKMPAFYRVKNRTHKKFIHILFFITYMGIFITPYIILYEAFIKQNII